MEDTKLAREKVAAELAKLKFKSIKSYRIFELIILTIIWGLTIALIVWLIVAKNYSRDDVRGFTLFIMIFLHLSQLPIFYQGKLLAKKNLQLLLLKNSRLNFHQIFFNHLANPFPDLDFKFTGISLSPVYQNNCLSFKINGEIITWNIDEEKQRLSLAGKKLPLKVKGYFLKYSLNSTASQLQDVSQITMVKLNEPFTGFFDHQDGISKTRLFKSESVEFNQRFLIKGRNELDTYKVFVPKVIDNYLQLDLDQFFTEQIICLESGKVFVNLNKTKWNKSSYTPDPLDFSKVRWNKKYIINDILDKIELDFQRYFAVQKLVVPLDLY